MHHEFQYSFNLLIQIPHMDRENHLPDSPQEKAWKVLAGTKSLSAQTKIVVKGDYATNNNTKHEESCH